jgi:anti-anti-sigma factor
MSVGELHVSDDRAWPVARLSGAVDLSNVDDLGVRLERCVSNRAHGLVLDLSDVTYLDSTGLRLIFRLVRQLGDRQQSMYLVVPEGSRIARVIAIAGVGAVAQVVPDLTHLPHGTEELP